MKTVIVYLPLDAKKAKEANLPVKLPILAEDLKKAIEKNELSPEVILRGLEAQVHVGKKVDYYMSYLLSALYDRARDAVNHGKLEEARNYVKRAGEYKKDYRYPFHLGIIERENKNLEISEVLLREALEMNEDFSPARLELARTLIARRDLDEAVEECKRVIERDPSFTLSYIIMGDAYLELGDARSAIMVYQKALSIDSNIPSVHWRIGVAANALQKFSLAERELKASIAKNEGGWQTKYNLSYSLYRLGKLFEALELLKNLLESGVNSSEVITELVILQKLLGLYEEALDTVELGLEMNIEEEGFLLAAVDVFAFNGMTDKALEICDERSDSIFESRKQLVNLENNWHKEIDISEFSQLLDLKNEKLAQRVELVLQGDVPNGEIFDESMLNIFTKILKIHGTHFYSAEKSLTQAAMAFSGSIDTVALFIFLYRMYLHVNVFRMGFTESLENITASITDISWKLGKSIVKTIDEEHFDIEESAPKKITAPPDAAEFFTSVFLALEGHENPLEFLKSIGTSQVKLKIFESIISPSIQSF